MGRTSRRKSAFFAVHQSPPNSTASPNDFGRHINLHLTYSFQQQHQQQQQPQLSPATCKSPTGSIYHNHGKRSHGTRSIVSEQVSRKRLSPGLSSPYQETFVNRGSQRDRLRNRDFVDSVLRFGTVDGRALAGLDAVVHAERGLMTAARFSIL